MKQLVFLSLLSFASASASATTIYVKPNYPIEALRNCIEGWVEFELTVMPDGSMKNVRVVGSHPAGIFEEAAREALKKHNLVPKVVNGESVPTPGVRRKITYKIDGECVPT
ncbi:energy transducer TonB [Microbulbifer halophilus]|uniref:Protein TonB n=1 Tax=Microbulbifer halophilus TaxID=453963 RepID=A0ABW5EH31_9GAMM|nr:energy transducer TonB [Microbulbifer halophilus]MCW8128603.1 energy transducer TonB [Microbulbifer halophilus]